MKMLKSKSLMSLIYAVLLALPLCAILSRVIYVQSNKNAYQSYSDATEVKTYINYDSVIGNTYIMNWVDDNTGMTNNTTQIIPYQSITITAPTGAVKFRYGNSKTIHFFDENDTILGSETNITSFTYVANSNTSLQMQPWFNRQLVLTQKVSLDNVFEYSVSKFVDENDFGQLNFFQWFEDMLLTNNTHNALYIHFANWYLNYAMLISLMQILFLVLMWFVNFARKLLDRGMNYDW